MRRFLSGSIKSPFDIPTEYPIKEFNADLFKTELHNYLNRKKEEHSVALFKDLTHYHEKEQYIAELLPLIAEYDWHLKASIHMRELDLKPVHQKLVDKLETGCFDFWTGLTPSGFSWMLTKWKFRVLESLPDIQMNLIDENDFNPNP